MSTAIAYPSAIARACAAVDESPVFAEMPDGYFRIVIRIIKKINLSCLSAPIFASRNTLAQESGKSVETVHRAIKWMEDRGLVIRTQRAHSGLKGSSSPLIPTGTLLTALTLQGVPSRASAVTDDTSISTKQKTQSIQKQSLRDLSANAKISTTSNTTTSLKNRGMVKLSNGRSMPADLVWMVDQNQLSFSAVLALMAQASKVGKKLSDIVNVARKHLEKLYGNSLFAYCRKLIQQDKDFAYLARRQCQDEVDQATKTTQLETLSLFQLENTGRMMVSKNGKYKFLIEKSGVLRVTDFYGEVRYGQVNAEFMQCVEAGKILYA